MPCKQRQYLKLLNNQSLNFVNFFEGIGPLN